MSLPKSVSLAFLDLMTCGFGGVIIVFLVLIAFFESQESESPTSQLVRIDSIHAVPLMIILQSDTSADEQRPTIWEDGENPAAIVHDSNVVAGTNRSRLVVCAADASEAMVKVDRLATDVPLQIVFYEGNRSLSWSGLYDDWPDEKAGRSDSLTLWPLPDSMRRGLR